MHAESGFVQHIGFKVGKDAKGLTFPQLSKWWFPWKERSGFSIKVPRQCKYNFKGLSYHDYPDLTEDIFEVCKCNIPNFFTYNY